MAVFNHNNSALRFCVDAVCAERISGRVFSRRFTRQVPFNDLISLALQLDKVFDLQSFPQAFQRARIFLREEQNDDYIAADPSCGLSREQIQAQRGDVLTFEIEVSSRRNASWQGTVCWVDSGERQEFPSVMDLLRLLQQKLSEHSTSM